MKDKRILVGVSALLLVGASAFATKFLRLINVHYAPVSGGPQTTLKIGCNGMVRRYLGTHGASLGQTIYTDRCEHSMDDEF